MIRLALIGYGYWGPNYARIVKELPECELVGCADVSDGALARARDALSQTEIVGDYRRLLDRDDVHGVIVATPAVTHSGVVRDCLAAGKDVLCEKPLCRSSDEARELARLSRACRRKLMVGHTFLFNPGVRMLKSYLDEGLLGEPLCVYSQRLGLGPIRSDVSVLWDLAVHDVSMLLHLFREHFPAEDVVARAESYIRPEIEDVAFLTFRLRQRLLANIHVSWLDPAKVRRLTVVGTEKMVVFDDVNPSHRLMLYDKRVHHAPGEASFGQFQAMLHDGDAWLPRVPAREPLKEQVAHFLACIRGEVECASDADFAADVVAVLEHAQQGLDAVVAPSQREPSGLPLPEPLSPVAGAR